MNDTTRETLERVAIETLRRMEKRRIQLQAVQREIGRIRDLQNDDIKKIEEYLDMIEKADPRFDRKAWLNHAEREMI